MLSEISGCYADGGVAPRFRFTGGERAAPPASGALPGADFGQVVEAFCFMGLARPR